MTTIFSETERFYNQESSHYSKRRYEGRASTYFQFLFRRRQRLFQEAVRRFLIAGSDSSSVFEIGCADGVILRGLNTSFPGKFSRLVGVDIAPQMIEAARKQSVGSFEYYVRGQEPVEKYDLVAEIGVHPFDLKGELEYVASRLAPQGRFIYSLSSRKSLHARFKLKGKDYLKDYKSYRDYEREFGRLFDIESKALYGLFVPKLWAFPVLGRLLQPLFELLRYVLPADLFHEQIYVLKLKTPSR